MRVKILFNKKENALIQMSDGTQAQLGRYILVNTLLSLMWLFLFFPCVFFYFIILTIHHYVSLLGGPQMSRKYIDCFPFAFFLV